MLEVGPAGRPRRHMLWHADKEPVRPDPRVIPFLEPLVLEGRSSSPSPRRCREAASSACPSATTSPTFPVRLCTCDLGCLRFYFVKDLDMPVNFEPGRQRDSTSRSWTRITTPTASSSSPTPGQRRPPPPAATTSTLYSYYSSTLYIHRHGTAITICYMRMRHGKFSLG